MKKHEGSTAVHHLVDQALEVKGWTRGKLAEEIGSPPSVISEFFAGRRYFGMREGSRGDVPLLDRIAYALDIPVERFYQAVCADITTKATAYREQLRSGWRPSTVTELAGASIDRASAGRAARKRGVKRAETGPSRRPRNRKVPDPSTGNIQCRHTRSDQRLGTNARGSENQKQQNNANLQRTA
jgi:hypothetical protein